MKRGQKLTKWTGRKSMLGPENDIEKALTQENFII